MRYSRHHQFLVLLLLVTACSPSPPPEETPPSTATPPGDDDAFVALFNGRTLEGWKVVPANTAADWSVRDGAIVGIGSADQLSYLVWREEHLRDFELQFRYRLVTDGNSGVEIRAQPDPSGKRPFQGYHADFGHVGIGPNILGSWDFHFSTRNEPSCQRGTRLTIDEDETPHLSEIKGALTVDAVRRRDWNDAQIIAAGNQFQFFINGKLASEFTDNARQGQLDQGAIGLQLHDKGMQVQFKDILLKKRPKVQGAKSQS